MKYAVAATASPSLGTKLSLPAIILDRAALGCPRHQPVRQNPPPSLSAILIKSAIYIYDRRAAGLLPLDTGASGGIRMRVLYVIFVLCVGALVWAAFAAASHIRRHEYRTAPLSPEPPQENGTGPVEQELMTIAPHSNDE